MHFLYIVAFVFVFAKSAFSEIFNDLGTGNKDIESSKEEVEQAILTTIGPDTWEHPVSAEGKSYMPETQAQHSHTMTRLIRTLSDGLNPQLLQQDSRITPVKRRKPVTLVGIRKHGVFPRESVNNLANSQEADSDVAELMSPFNDIGHFWDEDILIN